MDLKLVKAVDFVARVVDRFSLSFRNVLAVNYQLAVTRDALDSLRDLIDFGSKAFILLLQVE